MFHFEISVFPCGAVWDFDVCDVTQHIMVNRYHRTFHNAPEE